MLSRREEQQLCEEAMESISEEVTKEQNIDHFKAIAINKVICMVSGAAIMPMLFITLAIYCGMLGKVALALYTINKIAGYMTILQKRAMDKRIGKIIDKHTEELKKKGVNVDFRSHLM